LKSNQNVLIYTTHTKKVIARHYFFILRNKRTEKQEQVRNFAWHRSHFSDSDSASVPKFFSLDPGPAIFQIWESGYCLHSFNRRNRKLPMVLLQQWPRRLLLLLKLKIDSGSRSVFSKNLYSGSRSERKMQNLGLGPSPKEDSRI